MSLCVGLLLLGGPVVSRAGTTSTLLSPFTGDPASVQITFDDMVDPGNVKVTVDVVENPNTGDLRGVWFHLVNESLISGLSVINAVDVTQSVFGPTANSVNDLGGGNNLNGGGTPCGCDIGIEIGEMGIGMGDDFQTTMFTFTHTSATLTLADFLGQDVGARVTSVGLPGGSRNGSSKLKGVVPEPSTAGMLALGLAALAARGRIRRA